MQELLLQIDLSRFRLILGGGGLILIVIAAVYSVVPQLKEYRTAIASVAMLEEVSQDGSELDARLQERGSSIEALKQKLHGDMANLPPKEVEAYIIGRLQRISWNNDVELVGVQPIQGERVQIFREMLFNVQLVGEYADLYRWLWEARSELGFVVIKEYELNRKDNDDQAPRLAAKLSMASYRVER